MNSLQGRATAVAILVLAFLAVTVTASALGLIRKEIEATQGDRRALLAQLHHTAMDSPGGPASGDVLGHSISEPSPWTLWALALAITSLAGLLAHQVIRSLARPLSKLCEASEKVEAGDYSVRVDGDSSDELGDLCRAFNSMAIRLERNRADLEGRNHRLDQEVLQQTRALQETHDRLQSLDRMKDGFLSSISLELLEPVQSLGESMRKVEREGLTAATRNGSSYTKIQQAVSRLDLLIGELIDLARIRWDNPGMQRTAKDLKTILTETLDLCERHGSGPWQLKLDFPSREVEWDAFKLRRVLAEVLCETACGPPSSSPSIPARVSSR